MRKKNEGQAKWVNPDRMWHCVVHESGRILAVFGNGKLAAAQDACRLAEHTSGLPTALEPLYGSRPRVGSHFPNRRQYPVK